MDKSSFELEIFVYGMAQDENGDFTLADALTPPVEPQHYDVELRAHICIGTPHEDILTLAEYDDLSEEQAVDISSRLQQLLPMAEETRL